MQIEINNDNKELKSHGSYEFPLAVDYETLSKYDRGSFIWHWHPEVEFTFVLKGEIEYRINEKVYHLNEGEGLFGNSNTLHMGHMYGKQECIYVSTTFHPRIIYGYEDSLIKTKYVDRILDNNYLASIHFTKSCLWQSEILDDLASIYRIYCEKNDVYEMKIQMLLNNIWINIYKNNKSKLNSSLNRNSKNIERLKIIMIFINEHYNEQITLEDIAHEINICKSECCRFFKTHMKESLFDYLLNYRIEKSLSMLRYDKYNITEISSRVGFSSPAYFTKIFKRKMSCSPREYRKNRINLI